MDEPDAPASVLDASALMAHLNDEPGADAVRRALNKTSAISVFNWAEVLTKVAERGGDPELVAGELAASGLVGDALLIEGVTAADCIEIGRLRPMTVGQGLSLADRACLALAARLEVPVLTADSVWAAAEVGPEVRVIR